MCFVVVVVVVISYITCWQTHSSVWLVPSGQWRRTYWQTLGKLTWERNWGDDETTWKKKLKVSDHVLVCTSRNSMAHTHTQTNALKHTPARQSSSPDMRWQKITICLSLNVMGIMLIDLFSRQAPVISCLGKLHSAVLRQGVHYTEESISLTTHEC